jgi:hypothetical protein
MALRTSAKYVRGISRVRFIPHNGNGTYPGATSALGGVLGGAGPFNMSGADVTPATVPLSIKKDNGAAETKNLVLTTAIAAHATAVTAAEVVAAITTAAFTGVTASVDGTTGRVKIVTATGVYLQVYGQAAELAGFGRGIGAQFVKADTLESISVVPTIKADETDATTDANGKDTKCIVEGYVEGATGQAVDTAEDFFLMRLFSGGVIDSAGAFSFPNSNSVKPYFGIEIFNPVYAMGDSKQNEMTGYEKITVFNAMGQIGDDSLGKAWKKKNYTFTATTYKNAAGVEQTAVKYEYLTLAAYAALDIDNV